MELNINRLKVLGEEEIERLDNKIKEYKDKISILNKSIPDIKRQIDDLTSICDDEQIDYDLKISEHNKLLKKLNYRKKRLDNIKINTQNIDNSSNNMIVDICKKEELIKKLEYNKFQECEKYNQIKQQMSDLNIKEKDILNIVQNAKLKLDIEKSNLETSINSFNQKIKNMADVSLTHHNDFIQHINNIQIKNNSVNNDQNIFDSIKYKLSEFICKNIMYYEKDNLQCLLKGKSEISFPGHRYEKEKPFLHKFINVTEIKIHEESHFDHKKRIDEIHGFKFGGDYINIHEFINDNIKKYYAHYYQIEYNIDTIFHRKCDICNFRSGIINLKFYSQLNHDKKKLLIEKFNSHKIKCMKWFEDNYAKILNKIITHPELLILINKLNFEDFRELFQSYEPFNIKDMDSYEFICLIAFIGTNGYDINHMKLNEIE